MSMGTATATPCDLTLPYLALPRLCLPYLTLNLVNITMYVVLPYITPTRTANQLLKHTKPQFSFGKTELTRRGHCTGRALLGPKIHPVGTSCAQKIVVILTQFAFWATLDHSYVLQCLAWRFQCSHHAKITESLVFRY